MPDEKPPDSPVPPPEGVAPGAPASRPVPSEVTVNPRTLSRPAAPPAQPKTATSDKPPSDKPLENKDSLREVIETVVFVVVLVLMLKTFLAEAFVIPTGSMATTLLGYNIEVTCQKCGYPFLVNASRQVDPQEQNPQRVTDCWCPNCEYKNRLLQLGGGAPR
jgi:signal peptidase I